MVYGDGRVLHPCFGFIKIFSYIAAEVSTKGKTKEEGLYTILWRTITELGISTPDADVHCYSVSRSPTSVGPVKGECSDLQTSDSHARRECIFLIDQRRVRTILPTHSHFRWQEEQPWVLWIPFFSSERCVQTYCLSYCGFNTMHLCTV
jgi:hypothetical protein